MNTNNKQLDSYSILICSKYFYETQDYINIMCVCKKFKETTEKLRFNPIPITSLKLFPKIQTQHLYHQNDPRIKGIDNYDIWYEITYDQYLKYKDNNIKCHHIIYTSPNKETYEYTIPDGITLLQKIVFMNTEKIEEIVLPNSLTKIHDYCFYQCDHLCEINLPTALQIIGNWSFAYCSSLELTDIPKFVYSLGENCFCCCTTITSITLPPSLKILNSEVFNGCESLRNIVLPSTLLSIGNFCFEDCIDLETIILPSSLMFVGLRCFNNSRIRSITFPKSIKTIGINCFTECESLTELNYESNKKEFNFKVMYNDSILYKQNGITCTNIILNNTDVNLIKNKDKTHNCNKEFVIPNGIVKIADRAFLNEKKSKKISIPTTVTSIGNECFKKCTELGSIIIPSSIKTIGINCFEGCKSLTLINLPFKQTTIYPFKVSYQDYLIFKKLGIHCDRIHLLRSDYYYQDLYSFSDNPKEKIPKDIPLILNISVCTDEVTISNNIISIKVVIYQKILLHL